MSVNTTLSGLSQTAASNGPDGTTDAPSALDDAIRNALSFIAQLRDGKGHSAEVDVASASTCDIGAANSHFVRITGTTGISSLGTNYNGPRFIRFAGALTLTHNASTLILPGGANITTAAGDTCTAVPIGAPGSGWLVKDYTGGASIASSGYQKLPSGLIVQWGNVAGASVGAGSVSGAAVTFPIAFPTSCLAVFPSNGSTGAITYISASAGSVTTTGFTFYRGNSFTSAQSVGGSWFAIGY
jgi:hypothetical protein